MVVISTQIASCRDAIRRSWPAQYQEAAIFTMTKENGAELASRVSGLNYDGSRDLGCFQVNNKAHFGYDGWVNFDNIFNAEFNATYAYHIFQRSGSDFSPWYAVCSPSQIPKYPQVWCN